MHCMCSTRLYGVLTWCAYMCYMYYSLRAQPGGDSLSLGLSLTDRLLDSCCNSFLRPWHCLVLPASLHLLVGLRLVHLQVLLQHLEALELARWQIRLFLVQQARRVLVLLEPEQRSHLLYRYLVLLSLLPLPLLVRLSVFFLRGRKQSNYGTRLIPTRTTS